MCHGLASISRNEIDNKLSTVTPRNHHPEAIDLDVPFLRNALGKKAVDRTTTTPNCKSLQQRHNQTSSSCHKVYIAPDTVESKNDETIKAPTIASEHP
ncbi:hypothetical protein ACI65C_005096 [Semiaphis heraclei]